MAVTLKTIKSAGGDYSSLDGWNAGQQKIIAAGDSEEAECYAFSDTVNATISGWTTVATGYIRIYTPAAEQHTLTPGTGYRRTQPLSLFENYVRFEGIASTQFAIGPSGASDVRMDRCLSVGEGYYLGGGTIKVRNCISIRAPGVGFQVINNWDNPTVELLNCTSMDSGTYGFQMSSAVSAIIKNCYAGSSATADYTGTWTTFTTNASSDTTGTSGLQSIAYSTATFVNVTSGSEDAHLVSGSGLINVGTDLSGDFTEDADRVTRSGTWDIGADEYVAAGGTGNPWYYYAQC